MRKAAKTIAVIVILLLVAAGIVFMLPARTASIEGERAVASLETLRLGGTDQAVLIRGHDRSAPVLLYSSSGPHMTSIPFSARFARELEKHFVVVQWDPPGRGRSCPDEPLASPPRTDDLVGDTIELAEAMRKRFGQERVFLVGHSMGASVAALAAAKRPDLFHAFVGVSTAVHAVRSEEYARALTMLRAMMADQRTMVAELRAMSIPYASIDELFRQRQILGVFGGEYAGDESEAQLISALWAPEYTAREKVRYMSCAMTATRAYIDEYWKVDLFQQAPAIDVPVLFFQGRRDPIDSPDALEEYARVLRAPSVEIVWFERSGHHPPFEEPQRFVAELVARLEPLAAAGAAPPAPATN